MKLRLDENSVRIRLRRSEVERFAQSPSIEAATVFPNGRKLTFMLSKKPAGPLAVTFEGDRIAVAIAQADADAWTGSEQVGLYGREGGLEIMIEKDFRRTSMPSPDDADRYPNPRSAT